MILLMSVWTRLYLRCHIWNISQLFQGRIDLTQSVAFLHYRERQTLSLQLPNTKLLCVSCSPPRTQYEACIWVTAILCEQNASFLFSGKRIDLGGVSIPHFLVWKHGCLIAGCELHGTWQLPLSNIQKMLNLIKWNLWYK